MLRTLRASTPVESFLRRRRSWESLFVILNSRNHWSPGHHRRPPRGDSSSVGAGLELIDEIAHGQRVKLRSRRRRVSFPFGLISDMRSPRVSVRASLISMDAVKSASVYAFLLDLSFHHTVVRACRHIIQVVESASAGRRKKAVVGFPPWSE